MALTVKGVPINSTQLQVANIAIQEGKRLGAPTAAIEAAIYAGMGESSLGSDSSTYGGISVGPWQAQPPHYNSGHDWAAEVTGFYTGGVDFQAGGAIACARRGDAVWQIANEVEANAVWINSRGDSYGHQWSGGQAQGLAEAAAIVAAGGGGALKGGIAGAGGTGTGAQPSHLFTIGTTSNPNEDIWTGINRLAQSVNYYLFSDAETIYCIDGADLITQSVAPNATIDRHADRARIVHFDVTYDNTAFQYMAHHKRKGRVQRHSTLTKAVSPTMCKLDLICGIDEFRAGDVMVLKSCGPADGRWVIADVTRSVFAVYSELTLVPPITPLSEAQVVGTTGKAGAAGGAGGTTSTGNKLVDAVYQKALAISHMNLPYTWAGGHSSFAPAPGYDCSGYVSACLNAGGVLSSPGDSGSLESWGLPGPGALMTVWAAGNHVFIEFKLPPPIGHVQANTSPGPGPHVIPWGSNGQADAASGSFTPRHWSGA